MGQVLPLVQAVLGYLRSQPVRAKLVDLAFAVTLTVTGMLAFAWYQGLTHGHADAASEILDFLERSDRVSEILVGQRSELKADRLVVLRFHNGAQFLDGLPFLYVSASHEAFRPGMSPILVELQRIPLQTLSGLREIMAKRCVTADTSISPYYRALRDRYGVRTIVTCPIENLDGTTIGLVMAFYREGDDHPDTPAELARLAKILTGALYAKPSRGWFTGTNAG